jgi:hypothetical protein
LAHCNLGSNPEILSVILQSDVKDISLIPHALVAVVNKLAHFFTASRDNNPPLLELLHESITQRYWPPFDVHRWLLQIALAFYPTVFILDVKNNVYEFPSFVKEQRQQQRPAAT